MSLTSVPCKILEHIICSHVRDHLDRHNILSTLQHGFRERHSCESQLLTTLQDLLSLHDRGVQVDLVVLDFAKAFHTVPHESLLGKLKYYGIDCNINQWVRAFLTNRSQELMGDPHHTSDTNKLEQVQRRAARFVCNNYSPYSSVTQMLSDLGWQQLKDRRKHIRLALFYEIVHHHIAVPHEDILRKADSWTRSSHNYKYRTLRSHKIYINFPFFPGLYWNGIPCQWI